jgi:hypothetical protein
MSTRFFGGTLPALAMVLVLIPLGKKNSCRRQEQVELSQTAKLRELITLLKIKGDLTTSSKGDKITHISFAFTLKACVALFLPKWQSDTQTK